MDHALLAYFVTAAGLEASVHRLDDYVDMSELLAEHQERTGVRARLILLAQAFDEWSAGVRGPSLTCVVDRDDGSNPGSHSVLSTDYADLEMYAWTPIRVAKLLRLGFGIDVDADQVGSLMRYVEERAVPLCLCRRVVHERGEGAAPPKNVTRYACPRKGDFDLSGFIRAYGGPTAGNVVMIMNEVGRRTAAAAGEDARLHMNGHDLVSIATVAIQRVMRRTTSQSEVQSVWFASLEWRDLLESEPMFQALTHRLTG